MNLLPFTETYTERCPKCLGGNWRKHYAHCREMQVKGKVLIPERELLHVECVACGYYVEMACADAGEKA